MLACSRLRPPGVRAASATRAESRRLEPAAALPRGILATPLSSWAIAWTGGGRIDTAQSGRCEIKIYTAYYTATDRAGLREGGTPRRPRHAGRAPES